jgi:hypothetical protein
MKNNCCNTLSGTGADCDPSPVDFISQMPLKNIIFMQRCEFLSHEAAFLEVDFSEEIMAKIIQRIVQPKQ